MIFRLQGFRLFAFCRDHILVGILAVLCGLFGSAAVAAPGQLDPTFGEGGWTSSPNALSRDVVTDLAIQADGKSLVTGFCSDNLFQPPHTSDGICLARFSTAGVPDSSFGTAGRAKLALGGNGVDAPRATAKIAVQGDGKIVVASYCNGVAGIGTYADFCLMRFNVDGSLDGSFGVGGLVASDYGGTEVVRGLAITASGHILVFGECNVVSVCFVRYEHNGQIDASYGQSGIVVTPTLLLTDSGSINWYASAAANSLGEVLVTGYCANGYPNTTPDRPPLCFLRYSSTGLPDQTFGTGGKVVTSIVQVGLAKNPSLVQSNQSLVVFGDCIYGVRPKICMARFTPNGELDLSFGVGGFSISEFSANSLSGGWDFLSGAAQLLDGRIVLSGICSNDRLRFRVCLTRYLGNGALDLTYGQGGRAIGAWDAISNDINASFVPTFPVAGPNGKYLVAVSLYARTVNENDLDFFLIRLKGGPYNPLTCALNADANQTVDPATDALLLTRYLLGFRSDSLTTGAIGQNPTRTGQALEDHLASLNLDADGDGQALAMTDGLLMLRAMLGLTGTALTQGATNAVNPNVRNAQQILTWIESTHGVACLP